MVRPWASARPAPGSTEATTAAPLRMDRRDTSVEGTRAVVSSQQLLGILLDRNYLHGQAASTRHCFQRYRPAGKNLLLAELISAEFIFPERLWENLAALADCCRDQLTYDHGYTGSGIDDETADDVARS